MVLIHRWNMDFWKKKGGLWSLLTRGLYSEGKYRVISLGGISLCREGVLVRGWSLGQVWLYIHKLASSFQKVRLTVQSVTEELILVRDSFSYRIFDVFTWHIVASRCIYPWWWDIPEMNNPRWKAFTSKNQFLRLTGSAVRLTFWKLLAS